MDTPSASDLRKRLDLIPHPEGGYFREIYRSPESILHFGHGNPRAAVTSIYYLLEQGEFSGFHTVESDEIWCILDGGPLELVIISPQGELTHHMLGRDITAGQIHQAVVPAGHFQAARPVSESPWALCACIVAPGFDFADFAMLQQSELLQRFPRHSPVIEAFSRRG